MKIHFEFSKGERQFLIQEEFKSPESEQATEMVNQMLDDGILKKGSEGLELTELGHIAQQQAIQLQHFSISVQQMLNLNFDVKAHLKFLEDSQTYREIQQPMTKGKKLFLEVKVVDPAMSVFLYKWLYSDPRLLYFGCDLSTIHFGESVLTKESIANKLHRFIYELEQEA